MKDAANHALQAALAVETVMLDDVYHGVVVRGDIDISTSPKLLDTLFSLVDGGHLNIVLDLDGIKYVDSSGLGSLVKAYQRIKQNNGTIRVICNNPRVYRVFSITGMTEVFHLFSSLDEIRKDALARN